MTDFLSSTHPTGPVTDTDTASRRLNASDVRVLALSALGGALEFYDFVIFVFFANLMGALFFPPDLPEWMQLVQTFGIFAAGYLARPLGGIVMAHFGDVLGRKRMFMFSILLMSLPTLMIGLLPTYDSIGLVAPLLLLAMRLCQGAAIGGEAPGAWVFVAEHVPGRWTGVACASLAMGLVAGILIGSLVASALTHHFDDAQLMAGAWRIPFLLGGVFGLLSLYLRRYLHETPVFAEMQKSMVHQQSHELPIKQVLREHTGSVVLSMLATWILTGAVVVGVLMMPTLLQTSLGIDRSTALSANSLSILFTAMGCLCAGYLGDRIGFGKTFIIFSLGLALGFLLLIQRLHVSSEGLYGWYSLAGIFAGITGIVPAVMVRAFPPQVRLSGVSFSYNVAYAICGGLTPLAISLLMSRWDYAPALYLAFLGAIGCSVGIALMVKGQRSSCCIPAMSDQAE